MKYSDVVDMVWDQVDKFRFTSQGMSKCELAIRLATDIYLKQMEDSCVNVEALEKE